MFGEEKMKFDIVTVGSAVMDAFVETDLREKNGNIQVPTGCKVLVEKLWYASGGGGTNCAAAFSKLGLKTGFLGTLGDDENGEAILKELKKNKIKFLGKRSSEPTGYSVVLNSREKNRTILVYKGANVDLEFKKVKAKWIYFASMIDKSLRTQVKLAKWASRNRIKAAYNPSSYVIENSKKSVKAICKNCEILVLNEKEAKDLVGSVDFKKLLALGPRVVCVTLGKKGNRVSDGKNEWFSKPNSIKVFERTGAGDAFASGFVAGYIRFDDVVSAMKLGSANAESVIQKAGAKNGLLGAGQIGSAMRKIRVVKR
jgi:ribokinase